MGTAVYGVALVFSGCQPAAPAPDQPASGPGGSDAVESIGIDTTVIDQTTVSIVRIDTHGVRVDEAWDREWVDVDLALLEGAGSIPPSLTDPPVWSGQGAVHLRGNSSMNYDKKQYALETRDADGADIDIAPFGLPEEEDWILQGPYSDKTLMRNHLMYHWARAIGRYAPRTHFVELYLEDSGGVLDADDYRGVYVFMEKVKRDSNRVDVASLSATDSTEPAVSGGYLLKRDWLEGRELTTALYQDALVLEYPDYDEITSEQWSYLEGYLNDFEASLAREDGSYTSHADLDSFVDHMLMMELSRNVDAYVLSTWMHKDRDGLLTMGPIWDFNGSLGNADYFASWEIEGWHYDNPEFPADNPRGFDWYAQMLKDEVYRQRLSERWLQHRSDAWSDAALIADIDATAMLLEEAAARNFERWPVLGEYVWPNDFGAVERTSYAEEVDYLKTWLLARAAWIDQELNLDS